ncbi:DUF1003 domain-containing protein [Streptomyces sp. NPDC002144]
MIVSLEAIFLPTFVMVSQNRQAARENVRADLDFETNVRSEVWSIHMSRALGVDPVEVERRVQEMLAENRLPGRRRPAFHGRLKVPDPTASSPLRGPRSRGSMEACPAEPDLCPRE